VHPIASRMDARKSPLLIQRIIYRAIIRYGEQPQGQLEEGGCSLKNERTSLDGDLTIIYTS
jgi:hypothetical protein